MGRSFRHRSSSGSFSETEKKASSQAAQELFRILLHLKDHGGKSVLHRLDSLRTAQALLKRASHLDTNVHSTFARDFLLQADSESGYTPLHWAVLDGNLSRILLLLRYASSSHDARLAHRPMHLLQGDVTSIELVSSMVHAVDNEGLTPLNLLGKLQRSSLAKCRESLKGASVVPILQKTTFDDQDELAVLSENLSLLEEQNDTEHEVSSGCEVLTFGRANHCALGVPRSDASSNYPQRVQAFGLDAVGVQGAAVTVAAAAHHTLVVTRDGQLFSCGLGKGGRLGTGDERHRPLPMRVMGPLSRRKVVHAAAAENHSLCVTEGGNCYAWGSNRFGQIGCGDDDSRCFVPRRIEALKNCIAVAAGDRHSVALTRIGEVYTWGDNASGQLGGARRTGGVQRVDNLWNATPRKVTTAIAASEYSTLILTCPIATGLPVNSVYSWGHGNHVPIKVNFHHAKAKTSHRQRGVNPVGISCAKYHNAAVTDDGQVYTWGLHAEPLGTGTKSGQAGSNSMVIASPQLVTGMLPENGGGVAVAVSAAEHHTAVVTDCGHLYTWGATYGKDVLGHHGVRWQPNPRKVPGIHRAVGVAAAKEHNVMLVGTSFPNIPPAVLDSSLETMAALQVAKHVDLFNAIPILVTAERSECSFLKKFCNEFIRLNLDGVLTLGRKSEMDCYLNEQLADSLYMSSDYSERDTECHPLFGDLVAAGSTLCGKEADGNTWMEACTTLLERLPASTLVKYHLASNNMSSRRALRRSRALSFHDADQGDADGDATKGFSQCSERCLMLTTNMNLKTSEAIRSKVDCLTKEVRSVRKRLNQIAKLQLAESLTPEQQAKVERKSLLETDLTVLEPALETVEGRLRESMLQQEASIAPEPKTPLKEESEVKEFEIPQALATPVANPQDVFRCEICAISCSDATSLALHKSGRKHRNRVVQCEEEDQKQVAAAIMEEKKRQMLLQDVERPPPPSALNEKSGGPWKKTPSVQPRYTLPPPPHSSSLEWAAKSPPFAQPSGSGSATVTTKARLKTDFRQILEEEERKKIGKAVPVIRSNRPLNPGSIPTLKSPPWVSPVAKTTLTSPALGHATARSTATQESKKPYSLGDFLHSPAPPAKKAASAPAPWSVSPQAAATPTKASPAENAKSFLDIQQEEASFRDKQHKSYGVEGKWFIERRVRAGSMSAIQDAEEKNREHLLLIEEQKLIEEQIERDRQQQDRKKSRNRRPRKQSKSTGICDGKGGTATSENSAEHGNRSVKGGEGGKRRPKSRKKSNANDHGCASNAETSPPLVQEASTTT